ncbi:HRDC domain-containing protein [Candidatus Bipolaricaulota bacterium]
MPEGKPLFSAETPVQRMLCDMARRRPSIVEGFLEVSGVGQAKARQYGDEFVATIAEYCRSHSLSQDIDPNIKPVPKPTRVRRHSRGARKRSRPTVDLARRIAYGRGDRGESVSAVAGAIEKPPAVALKYLLDYIGDRGLASPEPWIDAATFARISEAAKKKGTARVMAILRELDGQATYDDIKIAIACIQNLD